ncbi:MAG: glycosyltransferase [Chthoniobacterales bacterium]|nr:glycosyltransferase [Chthoniobacterales bacterium]
MKALLLTNQYPPHVYGGAGVHVEYLARELAKTMAVEVRCFGAQDVEAGNLRVRGFESDTASFTCPERLRSVFAAARRRTDFNAADIDADLVHCHTWYSYFGASCGS